MNQKYIWITLGILFICVYIGAAFYVILQMDEPKAATWYDQTSELVAHMKTKLQDHETITLENHKIKIHKDDITYIFTSDSLCEYSLSKEVIIDQHSYQVDGKITIDFEQNEIEIFTNIDEWSEEKGRYENISIGSNRYSLNDLTHPMDDHSAFVDSTGKVLDEHRDIETFIGFDEVKDQITQIRYYHSLLISSLETIQ